MSDDQRVYSDEEFALILRKATELASQADGAALSAHGLTLSEMKAAAAQVGLDPALVERAALTLVSTADVSPLERLIGGPLRHRHDMRLPVKLTERQAERLLAVVRISAGLAGRRDSGHAGPMGMTWHDGGEIESLRVAARAQDDGTVVSVALGRPGTLGLLALGSGVASVLAILFAASALYPESPAQGLGGFVIGVGGILTAARAYWASSSRRARARIDDVIDVISRTITQPEGEAASDDALTTEAPAGAADARRLEHKVSAR